MALEQVFALSDAGSRWWTGKRLALLTELRDDETVYTTVDWDSADQERRRAQATDATPIGIRIVHRVPPQPSQPRPADLPLCELSARASLRAALLNALVANPAIVDSGNAANEHQLLVRLQMLLRVAEHCADVQLTREERQS